jgi:hypothetical protein
MIGHKQIVELRKNGYKPKAVFIFIDEHPKVKFDFEDPDRAVEMNFIPEVYTGITEPRKIDLTWIKGLTIHLQGGDMKEYLDWWVSVIDAEPSFLIGIDWDGQVNYWRKE